MSFKAAVEATAGLKGRYKAGLQAMSEGDRGRLDVTDTRRLCGSVNLDAALRTGARANEHVSDYCVCHTAGSPKVHWIEVHPASNHGVTELLAKLEWLKQWLAADGSRLEPLTVAYVWISSGKTTFTKTAPNARRLAQSGVFSAGRRYRLG